MWWSNIVWLKYSLNAFPSSPDGQRWRVKETWRSRAKGAGLGGRIDVWCPATAFDFDLDMIVNNFHGPAVLHRHDTELPANHWPGGEIAHFPDLAADIFLSISQK